MEKQQDEKRGLIDDDELDTAIANADDTGMVKTQQLIVEEQLERPQEGEEQTP